METKLLHFLLSDLLSNNLTLASDKKYIFHAV